MTIQSYAVVDQRALTDGEIDGHELGAGVSLNFVVREARGPRRGGGLT